VPATVDVRGLTQKLSKLYNCNCAAIEHPKIGKCLQLSGDHRDDLKQFLVKERIVTNVKDIKIHGF
jgi:translation initiation factor SUI1